MITGGTKGIGLDVVPAFAVRRIDDPDRDIHKTKFEPTLDAFYGQQIIELIGGCLEPGRALFVLPGQELVEEEIGSLLLLRGGDGGRGGCAKAEHDPP